MLETTEMPGPGEPILNTVGYLLHDGGHGAAPADWSVFLDFVRMHVLPDRRPGTKRDVIGRYVLRAEGAQRMVAGDSPAITGPD